MFDVDMVYPIWIVNLRTRTADCIICGTPAEREQVQYAVDAMADLFNITDVCTKYIEPEFEEIE